MTESQINFLLTVKVQGGAIDKVAKKTIRVLVVGNPANTNAVIWYKNHFYFYTKV
jgi:malate/lactate dehydrogenase